MRRRLWLWIVLIALIAPGTVVAEDSRSAGPNPVSSLIPGQNQDQPIQIEAATLEVRDKIKQATFSGDVVVVQGDTIIKCPTLVVFYGQEGGLEQGTKDAKPSPLVPTSTQNIRKIEARGGVTVFSKDQSASGNLGVYDLQAKTITLIGNVVVNQGNDVIHGERVVVDTTTGNARVESMNGGGAAPSRVRALIQPSKGQNGSPGSIGSGNIMSFGPSKTN